MSPCHGEDRGFEPRRDRHQCMCSSVVEHQPSKLIMRVRFPSHAPVFNSSAWHCFYFITLLAHLLKVIPLCELTR